MMVGKVFRGLEGSFYDVAPATATRDEATSSTTSTTSPNMTPTTPASVGIATGVIDSLGSANFTGIDQSYGNEVENPPSYIYGGAMWHKLISGTSSQTGPSATMNASNNDWAMHQFSLSSGFGYSYTDETTAANSSTVDDMTLTPVTPALGDAYFWGHAEQAAGVQIEISSASTDTSQVIAWEYWNGTVWASLSGVVDGTNSFQNSGLRLVTWTIPGDWATSTINSQGPYYFFRARVSAVGGTPNQALGRHSALDVTRYLPIPPSGDLVRTITSAGLTVTLSQTVDSISRPFG
jgi:hypothetical protein